MRPNPFSTIARMLDDYAPAKSPISLGLVSVVTLVFLGEAIAAIIFSVDSIRTFATGLFGVHPAIAWILAPVMHRDVSHYLFTVIGVLVLGFPLERHWTQRRFILFALFTGYVSVAAGAVVLLQFSESPAAFYGTSGVIYGLAGYALTHMFRSHSDFLRIEWISILIGVAAIIDVLRDVMTGPYFEPHWFNGGHLSGLVIGLVIGLIGMRNCKRSTNSSQ